jgi:hypothetical protein
LFAFSAMTPSTMYSPLIPLFRCSLHIIYLPIYIRVHDLAIVAKNSDICAKILHFPSFFFLF